MILNYERSLNSIMAEINLKFSLEKFPKINVRNLPSTAEGITEFYHALNPLSCFTYCQNEKCWGHTAQLPLKYSKNGENFVARCVSCKLCVQAIPRNKHSFYYFLTRRAVVFFRSRKQIFKNQKPTMFISKRHNLPPSFCKKFFQCKNIFKIKQLSSILYVFSNSLAIKARIFSEFIFEMRIFGGFPLPYESCSSSLSFF